MKNMTFHRVHHLEGRDLMPAYPDLLGPNFNIINKKELVRSRGRELRGTDYSVNDQFPKEILEIRRVLCRDENREPVLVTSSLI